MTRVLLIDKPTSRSLPGASQTGRLPWQPGWHRTHVSYSIVTEMASVIFSAHSSAAQTVLFTLHTKFSWRIDMWRVFVCVICVWSAGLRGSSGLKK